MKTNIVFNKDYDSFSIYVMKVYDAEVPKVWDYFTKAELLDQWWAPKPWKCETLKMDFSEGGTWLYAMVGPNNEKMYSKMTFGNITENRTFDGLDAFCDENGNINPEFSRTNWLVGFTGVEEGTKATFNLQFDSKESLEKILEMGFEEGFKAGLNQLEEILEK